MQISLVYIFAQIHSLYTNLFLNAKISAQFSTKVDEEILCKLYRQSCKALRKQINSS